MKKYLAMWSMVSVLILSTPVHATELACETENPTCKDMGYTYTEADIKGLSSDWECTACPLDATAFSCVDRFIEPEVKDPCEGYNLTSAEANTMNAKNGYYCFSCSSDETRHKCTARKCSSKNGMSYSTDYSQVCNKPYTVSQVYYDIYSRPYTVDETNNSHACNDGDFLRLWDYSACENAGESWVKYRCINGYSGEKPCLSSTLVEYRTGVPEPCSYLFNATPHQTCVDSLGQTVPAPEVPEDTCEGYNISEETMKSTYSNGGYSCIECPTNPTRFKCAIRQCPNGFSTAYSQVCTLPTRYVRYKYSNSTSYTYDKMYACQDDKFLNQYGYSAFDMTGSNSDYECLNYGSLWVEYRCQNGYSGSNPCLSSYTVEYREGANEPCAELFYAQPYEYCVRKLGKYIDDNPNSTTEDATEPETIDVAELCAAKGYTHGEFDKDEYMLAGGSCTPCPDEPYGFYKCELDSNGDSYSGGDGDSSDSDDTYTPSDYAYVCQSQGYNILQSNLRGYVTTGYSCTACPSDPYGYYYKCTYVPTVDEDTYS